MKEFLQIRGSVWLLAACLLAAAPALPQSTIGSVNGTISDLTGAVIPGTSVTLSNVGTGVEVANTSNASGFFVFVNVQPGNYTLVAEQEGFKTALLPTFNVGVNQTVTQNISLEVGSVAETIEVMAQAELLQQSTSELGTVIGVKAVEDLPLNGRNFTQLLTLTPGATPVSTAQSNGIGSHDLANVGVPGASFSNPSIHGQWNRMNIHLLDGLSNTNFIGNMYVIPPIIDAIEEFKVQSHNDKAEFGGVLGGIINVISKTGTNEFHGSLWEFVRNDVLNARDPFADEFNVEPAAFRQNQFGASVGGPIIKNRTFFHAAYEGWRYSNPRSNRYYVPTDAQLGGDFSEWPTGRSLFNPLTTRPDPDSGDLIRDRFPNDVIPSSMLDQSMQTYLRGYYDRPNLTGDPQFNVINGDAATNDANNFQVRVDHQFSELDRAWFRYSKIDGAQLTPSTQLINEVGEFPFFSYGGGWFHSFSPTLIMDHSYGYSKEPYRQGTLPDEEVGDGPALAAGFGTIDGVQPIPRIAIGSGGFAGGDVGALRRMEGPLEFHYEQFHYTGNLSWIRGNHTIKFGAQTLRHTLTPGSTGSISFNFTEVPTRGLRPGEVGSTGDPVASALIGVPSQVSGGLPSNIFFGYQTFGAYVQDEWKVRRNLTLNIGLRFDHLMWPDVESDTGRFKTNYDLATGDFLIGLDSMPRPCNEVGIAPCIPGDGLGDVPHGDRIRLAGHTSIGPIPTWDNWQPRFGLAWSMNPTTVLRVGYGIVFDQLTGVNQSWQGSGGWPSNDGFFEPTNAVGEPVRFIDELRTKLGSPLPGPQPWGDTCWCVDHNNKRPMSHQWNVELQKQISQNLVVSGAYVASVSRRLQITGLGNTAQPGTGSAEEVQARKPHPPHAHGVLGRRPRTRQLPRHRAQGRAALLGRVLAACLVHLVAGGRQRSERLLHRRERPRGKFLRPGLLQPREEQGRCGLQHPPLPVRIVRLGASRRQGQAGIEPRPGRLDPRQLARQQPVPDPERTADQHGGRRGCREHRQRGGLVELHEAEPGRRSGFGRALFGPMVQHGRLRGACLRQLRQRGTGTRLFRGGHVLRLLAVQAIRMGRRTLGGGALRVLQHPQSGELRGARLDGALPDHGQGLQHGRSDAAGAVRAEDNILNLAPGPLPGRLQEA